MKYLLLLGLGVSCLLLAGCDDGGDSTLPPPAPGPAQADIGATPPASPDLAPPPAPVASDMPAPPVAGAPVSAPAINKDVPGVLEGANAFSMPDLINLNNAYQAFRSVEMRSPRDLNELVSSKQIESIPPAPGGKKFAIDERNLRIILVNQ